jgi:molybdopterin-guanine dinucleotide biosynthesis protein A
MNHCATAPEASARARGGAAHPASREPLVAILAGGEGRRLGGDKALAKLRGAPLISYPLRAAAEAGLERVVVAKLGCRLPPLGCETVHDDECSTHPASGICAAQRHAAGRPLVVLACDMPFLTGALISWLATRPGSAVVEAGGRMQPLLARYEPALAPVFERSLRRRGALQAAVAAIDPLRLGERELEAFGDPRRLCFNVNDHEDLARAERMLAGIA